jgi:hypothetical protein
MINSNTLLLPLGHKFFRTWAARSDRRRRHRYRRPPRKEDGDTTEGENDGKTCVMFDREGALGTRQFCIREIVRLARRSDAVALGRVWD